MDILSGGHVFLEAPRWHNGAFWASDVMGAEILSIVPGASAHPCSFAGAPSGLGWMSGVLVAVCMARRALIAVEAEERVIADLSWMPGSPNDLLTDSGGRAYVGSTGFDLSKGEPVRTGAIALVDESGESRLVASDLLFPNGMALVDVGRSLIVAETFGQRLSAYDVAANGDLHKRRVWASFGDEPSGVPVAEFLATELVLPDGIAADAEGRIWVADARGGRALLVAEGGEIIDEVRAPEGMGVYACALGGEDGKTLLLCINGATEAQVALRERKALLAAVRVDVGAA